MITRKEEITSKENQGGKVRRKHGDENADQVQNRSQIFQGKKHWAGKGPSEAGANHVTAALTMVGGGLAHSLGLTTAKKMPIFRVREEGEGHQAHLILSTKKMWKKRNGPLKWEKIILLQKETIHL